MISTPLLLPVEKKGPGIGGFACSIFQRLSQYRCPEAKAKQGIPKLYTRLFTCVNISNIRADRDRDARGGEGQRDERLGSCDARSGVDVCLTLRAAGGAPLDVPENMALLSDAILAGRWLLVPSWRAFDTRQTNRK